MTSLQIRTLTDGSGRYVQTVTLDGRVYLMTLQWSIRDGHWFMDLADQDSVNIPGCIGRKLVADYQVLRSVDPRRPPGELIVAGSVGGDPGLFDLGGDQALTYAEAADLGRSTDFFGGL